MNGWSRYRANDCDGAPGRVWEGMGGFGGNSGAKLLPWRAKEMQGHGFYRESVTGAVTVWMRFRALEEKASAPSRHSHNSIEAGLRGIRWGPLTTAGFSWAGHGRYLHFARSCLGWEFKGAAVCGAAVAEAAWCWSGMERKESGDAGFTDVSDGGAADGR